MQGSVARGQLHPGRIHAVDSDGDESGGKNIAWTACSSDRSAKRQFHPLPNVKGTKKLADEAFL